MGWIWREYYGEQGSSTDHLNSRCAPKLSTRFKRRHSGDKVISIDGTSVTNSNELNDLLEISYWSASKENVRIVFERNGKQHEVSMSREGVQTFEKYFLAEDFVR